MLNKIQYKSIKNNYIGNYDKGAKKMKKLCSVMIIFIVIMGIFQYHNIEVTADSTYTNIGDVNNDGQINVADAIEILRYYAVKSAGVEETSVNVYIYDVNKDKKINIEDAIIVLEYYAKKSAGLPASLPNFQYEFGQVLNFDSDELLYKLKDKIDGDTVDTLTKNDIITVVKNCDNGWTMLSKNGKILFIKMYTQLFTLLYETNLEWHSRFGEESMPKVGDFVFYYSPYTVIIYDNQEDYVGEIKSGDRFCITGNEDGMTEYKIVTEDGTEGFVTMTPEEFIYGTYNITPDL